MYADHPGDINVILHRVHELVASTSAKASCQDILDDLHGSIECIPEGSIGLR